MRLFEKLRNAYETVRWEAYHLVRKAWEDAQDWALSHECVRLRVNHARFVVEHIRDGIVLSRQVRYNLITNAGRQFIHQQAYGTTGLGSNGLNYIALSNDTLTETATSTTLSNEITTNGLARTQGTVVLPTGSGTSTTVSNTFTATGSQSAQKAALFTASSSGTMCHVLSFTQRSLITNDQLAITYTITTS